MMTVLDPATADLLFTCICSFSILGMAGIALISLPWSDAEIEATERTAHALLIPVPSDASHARIR
jgi:hypothetical protein